MVFIQSARSLIRFRAATCLKSSRTGLAVHSTIISGQLPVKELHGLFRTIPWLIPYSTGFVHKLIASNYKVLNTSHANDNMATFVNKALYGVDSGAHGRNSSASR